MYAGRVEDKVSREDLIQLIDVVVGGIGFAVLGTALVFVMFSM